MKCISVENQLSYKFLQFLTRPPTDFSAFKKFKPKCYLISKNRLPRHCRWRNTNVLINSNLFCLEITIKLESSHRPQVPPPRQRRSPGGVTIFALPAVPLCPL